MLEKDLKDIWSKSAQGARISIESNQLEEELNSRLGQMKKRIRIRDLREIVASILGGVFFSYLAYEIPFLLSKLACLLSVFWFIYVILKFRLSRKQNKDLDLSLSLRNQLEKQLIFMEEQENLLDSANYWYAIPPFLINIVFIIGLGDPLDVAWSNSIAETLLPLSGNFKLVLILGLFFFYALIIWMNKKVLDEEIRPLLRELDKSLRDFKEA